MIYAQIQLVYQTKKFKFQFESLMTTSTTTSSTTSTSASKPNTSILILGDWDYDKIPVITDSNGKVEYVGEDFDFEFGEQTEVDWSCSVKYRGDFYVFGGRWFERQISKLEGCSLTRIGSLDFDFEFGGCAAVNDESIYLCFPRYYDNQCHVGTDPVGTFSKVTESLFDHGQTRVAANEGNDLD